MHLNQPNRPAAFQTRKEAQRLAVAPRKADWTPFSSRLGAHEYDLVPYANSHPIRKLYPDDEELAVFSRIRHRKNNPLLDAAIVCEQAKVRSAAEMSKYIEWASNNIDSHSPDSLVRQDNILHAATNAVQAFTNLINTCIVSLKESPDNLPIELHRLDRVRRVLQRNNREECTISYKTYAVLPQSTEGWDLPQSPVLQGQSTGTVTWAAPCPWHFPSLMLKEFHAKRTVTTIIESMTENIYTLIEETLPKVPETARVRALVKRALKHSVLTTLIPQPPPERLEAGMSEHSVQTTFPLAIFSGDERDPDDDEYLVRHTIMLSAQSVNVCADWHNPRVNQLLKSTILKTAKDRADSKTTNLCNISVRILARVVDAPPDDTKRRQTGNPHRTFDANEYIAKQWECHVLDIMPFAGNDTCTVTTLHYEQQVRPDSPAGFVRLPDRPEQNDSLAKDIKNFSDMHIKACIGSQRNIRYNDLQIAKLLADGCKRHWYKGDITNFVRRMQYSHSDNVPASYAARISCDNWDYALCSHTVGGQGQEVVHTVITAVHYPPRITHSASRGVIPQVMKASSHFFIHFAAADMYSPDFRDTKENWVSYYAKGQDQNVDTRGLTHLNILLRQIKRDMAKQGWGYQTRPFFEHIAFEGLHPGSSQFEIDNSLRGHWIFFWRHVIKDAIMARYLTEHGLLTTQRIDVYHKDLLDHGVFQVHAETDADQHAIWTRILGDSRVVDWYMNFLYDYYVQQSQNNTHDRRAQPAPAHSHNFGGFESVQVEDQSESVHESGSDHQAQAEWYAQNEGSNPFETDIYESDDLESEAHETAEKGSFETDVHKSNGFLVTLGPKHTAEDPILDLVKELENLHFGGGQPSYAVIQLNIDGKDEHVVLCDMSPDKKKITQIQMQAQTIWREYSGQALVHGPRHTHSPKHTTKTKRVSSTGQYDNSVRLTTIQREMIVKLQEFAHHVVQDLPPPEPPTNEPIPEHPEYVLSLHEYTKLKEDEPDLIQFIHNNKNAIIHVMVTDPHKFKEAAKMRSPRFSAFISALNVCREIAYLERIGQTPEKDLYYPEHTRIKKIDYNSGIFWHSWSSTWALLIDHDIQSSLDFSLPTKERNSFCWFLQFPKLDTSQEIKTSYIHRLTEILSLVNFDHPKSTKHDIMQYLKTVYPFQIKTHKLFTKSLPSNSLKLSPLRPPPQITQHSSRPQTAAPILAVRRNPATPAPLAVHVSRLERKLESTERMGNMKHLLDRLLTKLDSVTLSDQPKP